MSKKITFISIGLIIVLIAGYLFASPYIVLSKIKNSVDANDHGTISSYIDFPSVRQSLKDQMNQKLKEEESNSEKNEFAELSTLVFGAMIDKIVDTMVTPQGVTMLIQGKDLNNLFDPKGAVKVEEKAETPKKDLNYDAHYESLNRFHVDIKNSSGDNEVTVVMTRDGLSWKITDLIMHEKGKKSSSQEPSLSAEGPQKAKEVIPEAPKVQYESLSISETEIGNGDFHLSNPPEYNGHAIFFLTPAGMDNILEQVLEDPTATGYVKVEKAYKFSDQYLLVVSTGEYGMSCPATTYVIGYDTKTHSVSGSKKLESCSENIEAMTEGNKLTVKKENESMAIYNAVVN